MRVVSVAVRRSRATNPARWTADAVRAAIVATVGVGFARILDGNTANVPAAAQMLQAARSIVTADGGGRIARAIKARAAGVSDTAIAASVGLTAGIDIAAGMAACTGEQSAVALAIPRTASALNRAVAWLTLTHATFPTLTNRGDNLWREGGEGDRTAGSPWLARIARVDAAEVGRLRRTAAAGRAAVGQRLVSIGAGAANCAGPAAARQSGRAGVADRRAATDMPGPIEGAVDIAACAMAGAAVGIDRTAAAIGVAVPGRAGRRRPGVRTRRGWQTGPRPSLRAKDSDRQLPADCHRSDDRQHRPARDRSRQLLGQLVEAIFFHDPTSLFGQV